MSSMKVVFFELNERILFVAEGITLTSDAKVHDECHVRADVDRGEVDI